MSVYPESSVVVNQQVPNMYPAPMTTTVVLQQPQQAPGKLVCSREGHRGWSSGMFACGDDVTNCCLAVFCQELVLMDISRRTGENVCVTCCVPGGLLAIRARLRTLGGIQGSICEDYLSLSCCYLCALCQMQRELDSMGL
ncbi:cornifelin homolog A-like [Ruditapes philippinarum]|uniref:cornifelin homolog A-like n=1 Tax=Ruditapes philippinarum TaxID=129788 RepID=UPI00295B994C|nr:cornifelin homolog A-like [Ruditapes philippinarum]